MRNKLYGAIILGAIWGILEATVGYLLHLSGLKIGSYIWFPIAYFFVHRAYRHTGSFPAAMLTALIASSIKLIDLFFPGRIDMVINPAVSIILEALAIVLVYKYVINRQMNKISPLTVALTGSIWRGLYVCYIFLMPRMYFDISSFTAMESFLEFLFVKNMINITIISVGFFAAKVLAKHLSALTDWLREGAGRRASLKPVFAAGLMISAVIVQVFIR